MINNYEAFLLDEPLAWQVTYAEKPYRDALSELNKSDVLIDKIRGEG